MLLSNLLNDSFSLLSKQLKFYSWHYKRGLDQRQRQELLDILNESHFSKLANKITDLNKVVTDSRQQIAKVLFENCLTVHRRHQLKQLIQSGLVDINVRLDNYGRTLLHRTAYNLDPELVKLLIDHNVNLRATDYAGNTALHIAIQSYRNGALIFNNEPDVVQNLTTIIRLLLDADKSSTTLNSITVEIDKCKRIKLLDNSTYHKEANAMSYKACADNNSSDNNTLDSSLNIESSPKQIQNIRQQNLSRCTAIASSEITICRIFGSQSTCKSHCSRILTNSSDFLSVSEGSDKNCRDHITATSESLKVAAKSIKSFHPCDDVPSGSLVEAKNAFGRTALHYCVLVVGEKHLDHFVELLLHYGADSDAIDTKLKTPLYCLVKRPGVSSVRPKCRAIDLLLSDGCDDLGLALNPGKWFSEKKLKQLEENIDSLLQEEKQDEQAEPVFTSKAFKRVPSLKHLARLLLIKRNGANMRQRCFVLPENAPFSLNHYVNRKILDQSEFF